MFGTKDWLSNGAVRSGLKCIAFHAVRSRPGEAVTVLASAVSRLAHLRVAHYSGSRAPRIQPEPVRPCCRAHRRVWRGRTRRCMTRRGTGGDLTP